MNIKPEELISLGYKPLDELPHDELVPFIQKWMKKPTLFSRLYYLFNFMALGLALWLLLQNAREPSYSFGDRFMWFGIGLAISFALVPLHEYLHVLAYKWQGASSTSYDANLRKFFFLALADRFVANRKEFVRVALLPFISITLLALLLIYFTDLNTQVMISGTLLAHTAMCSGDFGLLSYFAFHSDKEVVTYDDLEQKTTWFYKR